ncbi:Uncharacterised protein [Mycobacteroides abscessus subsp. bolletii]|uniref:ORC-CDC6 family AAA ATPase n=1 Tax=Mycobacteroides abscessus TaxID=36809 RepID=UPI0009C5ECEB|nr:hypothetical protein [Mycobacteroides abscessus]SKU75255.1 Uncharacterised protein [Mycobacteroides abscessus subsp. bolletii]
MQSALNGAVNNALMRAYTRSEKADEATLTKTFVSILALESMLRTPQHQVVYGRRGTGKTHILKYLTNSKRASHAAIYIDVRTIGSSMGLYGDTQLPVAGRATTLLVDVVEAIHTHIFELTLSHPSFNDRLHEIGPRLDALGAAATQVEVTGEVETELTSSTSAEAERGGNARMDISKTPKVTAGIQNKRSEGRSTANRRTQRGLEQLRVSFGQLSAALRGLVDALPNRTLWILIDEWSSLPLELQPFLADLLRRTAFTVSGITVKIGAIERRSNFVQRGKQGDYIGIELGADTAASIDIDDYLTFEDNRGEVQDFFANLLFNHATQAMAMEANNPGFPTPNDFVRVAFAEGPAFQQLCFFSEGVPRDALQIASLAASLAQDAPISEGDVVRSNRDYFRRDKEGRLSAAANRALNEIAERCVENDRRIIGLRRPNQSHSEVVQELYDFRLLHRRAQRTSIPERPISEKYDLFLVDLGCFDDLLRTGRLRLVNDGGLAPGIVRAAPRDVSSTQPPRPSVVLIPDADRWT